MDVANYRAFGRAIATLDLSTTPEGDSWLVRTQRLLFLKEILDRIELPGFDEIPGKKEVVDETISRWTIPNTEISIEKVEQGPRAGQFLFSAETVERLDRYFRQVQHLPYKPKSTIGVYETFMQNEQSSHAREQQMRNRLKPVDTSSPRATLEGFLESIGRAYELIMQTDAALRAHPPTMLPEQARKAEIEATNLLRRATVAFDLSQVPEELRGDVGMESALQLKEIFDRMALPPVEVVPNAQMVTAAKRGETISVSATAGVFRWRYPNTELEIVEITEGERQGQFLFSAATIDRVDKDYEEVRDLPYRSQNLGSELLSRYRWPYKTEGFYQYYISTPGHLIPRANFMGKLVDDLPAWSKTLYRGQTLWQWVGLFLVVSVVVLAIYLVFRSIRGFSERLIDYQHDWLRILLPILIAIILSKTGHFIDQDLNITGDLLAVVMTTGKIIALAMTGWAVFLLFVAVAETIIATPSIPDESIDATLLRIAARVIGSLLGVWVFVAGVRNLGLDVIPLLAGLGVGGLAVALAAQRTFANFIGAIILFINKPVRVGDFCRYGDQVGTVEHIGLISTRIRSLERTIVTVPNAEFSEIKLETFEARDKRLVRTTLGLRYETTPEQMRYVLAKLREMLLGHPKVTQDPARVRFVGYGAYSKDVEIFAYLLCQDQNTFLSIQEDVLLRVEDIVVASGTGFALPSQTAYLARDSGLNAERKDEVETEVESWRVRGKLPFPEFEEEEQERLEDILDYPPKGSPDFHPRGG